MDKSVRIRWSFLLSALAATLAAIAYPVEQHVYEAPSAPVTHMPHPVVAPPNPADGPEREIWIASDEDPFAARNWQLAPPPLQAPAPPPAPQQVIASEPQPTALPYRFLGQMQDGPQRVVYLGRGEQMILAHQGDVIESSYKVVNIGDTQIEFESIQSGTMQTLTIPAQ